MFGATVQSMLALNAAISSTGTKMEKINWINKLVVINSSTPLQVTKPLLETSRKGYLAAISASSYSYVSLLKYFAPIMNQGIINKPLYPMLE